jgi:AraC-like DNA-binding protein
MTTGVGIVNGPFGRLALLDMDTSLTVHAHAHCHIVMKVDGPDQEFTVEGTDFPLRDDTAVLVNAWQEHNYPHHSGALRSVFLALYLDPAWLAETDRLFSACALPTFFRESCVSLNSPVREKREILVGLLRSGMPGQAEMEAAILALMMALKPHVEPAMARSARPHDYRVRRAAQYMKDNVRKPYDYHEVANVAGLSRSRFNALFRSCVGVAPAVYGNSVRVEASLAALQQEGASITAIADHFGFSAPSNFCRFLQQHTGVVPSEFRRVAATVSA